MPSCLKGIETPIDRDRNGILCCFFGYAFPFEGNRNSVALRMVSVPGRTLDMPSRLKGIETHPLTKTKSNFKVFGYAFPFEGNRNIFIPLKLITEVPLYMPSRLKGIETTFTTRS